MTRVQAIEVPIRLVLDGYPDRSRPPCHPDGKVWCSLSDGVLTGSCSECGQDVVRLGRDGEEEWLLLPLLAPKGGSTND